MESIEEPAGNLKLDDWEREVRDYVFRLGQAMAQAKLEQADDKLMKEREEGLVVEGFRERRVVTLFGDVMVKRRLYRDQDGEGRFLLDEAMGLEKRSPLSRGMRERSAGHAFPTWASRIPRSEPW